MNKEERELEYSKIFARYVNSCCGWNYDVGSMNVVQKDKDSPDIDVVLISSERNTAPLFLQVTGADRPEGPIWQDPETHKDTILFSGNEIDSAIGDKSQKYKNQGKNFSKVILIIEGALPREEAERLCSLSRDTYKDSEFLGIYYVSYGATYRSEKGSEHHPESVSYIKRAFKGC